MGRRARQGACPAPETHIQASAPCVRDTHPHTTSKARATKQQEGVLTFQQKGRPRGSGGTACSRGQFRRRRPG
eukprot:3756600-Rhodomonas_salina.1